MEGPKKLEDYKIAVSNRVRETEANAFKETLVATGSPKAALDAAKRVSHTPERLRYLPHQGVKECMRRLKQAARAK